MSGSAYRILSTGRVVETLERLSSRIGERFPQYGLHMVSLDLVDFARTVQQRMHSIAAPIIWVRAASAGLGLMIVVGLAASLRNVHLPRQGFSIFDFVQALEAGINDVVLIGAAIFFLMTLENRIKRRRILRDLHTLRSFAHVVDMHQLTKDPERVLLAEQTTASSPRFAFTAFELNRYLDYCSELLSVVGKLAALYAEHFSDPVVLEAINDIESLTTGLSRKIWQKLIILQRQLECSNQAV